jgi:hypothetical protein
MLCRWELSQYLRKNNGIDSGGCGPYNPIMLAPRETVLLVPCGAHALCLNRTNGLLGLLDPPAAILGQSWLESCSPQTVAELLHDAKGMPIEAANEFVGELLASPLFSCEFARTTGSSLKPSEIGSRPSQVLRVQLPNGTVLVESWVDGTGHIFNRLQPLSANGQTGLSYLERLQIVSSERGNAFYRDGVLVCTAPDLDQTEGRLLELLLQAGALQPEQPPLCFLHAACLSWCEHAVLISGQSGSGKSTLALALCAAGAKYLGDELCAVGRNDGTVMGLATAISIKPSGRAAALALLPQDMLPPNEPDHFWQIDPSVFAKVVNAVSLPTVLIFPAYRAGSTVLLRGLALEDTVARLLTNGVSFGLATEAAEGAPPPLADWLTWLRGVRAFELTYGDTAAALLALEGRLDG